MAVESVLVCPGVRRDDKKKKKLQSWLIAAAIVREWGKPSSRRFIFKKSTPLTETLGLKANR